VNAESKWENLTQDWTVIIHNIRLRQFIRTADESLPL